MWKQFVQRPISSYRVKVAPTQLSGVSFIVRRIQKRVIRILHDPESIMSKSASFEQQQTGTDSTAEAKQYAAFRNANKQDNNCRTCTDFKSWSKQQRLITNAQETAKEKFKNSSEKPINLLTAEAAPREDCPLDKVSLGVSTWGLLHTMAAFYSDNPTDTEKRDMRTFFDVLSRLYPCEYCAKDFRSDIKVNPVNVNSQKDLSLWLCNFHNRVNSKLGKPLFDCTKVNERWRDGWLDGSCD